MFDDNQPLVRTDSANQRLTVGLVIVALILLLLGNNIATSQWTFLGNNLNNTLASVGLAIFIASITQFYTDFKVRSKFYRDIADNIVANRTIVDSGIMKFFRDSKMCLPESLLKNVRTLDVGMVYSDRFLKDNIGILEQRGDELEIRLFCPDPNDICVIENIAFNVDRKKEDISGEFEKLKSVITALADKGVKVQKFHQRSIPHYSFYIIDNTHYFLTLSTFASRRATVPLLQVEKGSPIALMIDADIARIRAITSSL